MVAGGAVFKQWAVALVVAIEALEAQARGHHSAKARKLLALAVFLARLLEEGEGNDSRLK